MAWKGALVAYSTTGMAYGVWDPESHIVYNFGDPDFDESKTPGWWRAKAQQMGVVIDVEEEIFRDLSMPPPPLPNVADPQRAVDDDVANTNNEGEPPP